MIKKDFKNRLTTSILLLFVLFLVFKYNFFLVFCLLIFGVISLLEFFIISKKIFKNIISKTLSNFLFSSYVFIFCIIFFIFSNVLQSKLILFTLLLSCIASDIGGFVCGKIFKGPKLTSISPNKTVIGSIGSFIFTALIFSITIFYYTGKFNLTILLISFITSIACQLGDLFFSYLKRRAKIKDTGKIFPGHGGVLDRLDSIYFGIPIGFTSFVILY